MGNGKQAETKQQMLGKKEKEYCGSLGSLSRKTKKKKQNKTKSNLKKKRKKSLHQLFLCLLVLDCNIFEHFDIIYKVILM